MTLPAGKSWILQAMQIFRGWFVNGVFLVFGQDDAYSFSKYSQIQNSEMKSKICSCYGQNLSSGLSDKVKLI